MFKTLTFKQHGFYYMYLSYTTNCNHCNITTVFLELKINAFQKKKNRYREEKNGIDDIGSSLRQPNQSCDGKKVHKHGKIAWDLDE